MWENSLPTSEGMGHASADKCLSSARSKCRHHCRIFSRSVEAGRPINLPPTTKNQLPEIFFRLIMAYAFPPCGVFCFCTMQKQKTPQIGPTPKDKLVDLFLGLIGIVRGLLQGRRGETIVNLWRWSGRWKRWSQRLRWWSQRSRRW